MSLFDMQGMEAEDSKFRMANGRTVLSTVSTVIGECHDSTLSAIAHC